jgi:DNA-directed RNA polymerase subunit RPC12/RpoP
MKSIGIPHQYACFSCRKCFKRPQFSGASNQYMEQEQQVAQWKEAERFEATRVYKCPDCGEAAHFMGVDFKAPRRSDVRGWRNAAALVATGKQFTRGVALHES